MSIPAPPPPTSRPKNEVLHEDFYRSLLKSVYLIWERVGAKLSVTGNVGLYGTDPVDQGAALTASNTDTPNSGDATTDAIIANLQTRVDELEARLDSSTGIGIFT